MEKEGPRDVARLQEVALQPIMDILSVERPLSREEWDRVRKLLQKLVPGSWFAVAPYCNHGFSMPFVYMHGYDKSTLDKIGGFYARISDFLTPIIGQRGRPIRLADLVLLFIDRDDVYRFWERTRLYKDIVEPAGMYYFLRTPLIGRGELLGEVKQMRPRDMGEYTDKEVEIMTILQPYLSHAILHAREEIFDAGPSMSARIALQGGGLSERETEVAVMILDGMSNPGIAKELGISTHTVKDHVKSIFKKLDIAKRKELGELVSSRYRESSP